MSDVRPWAVEQVVALAPKPSALSAAQPLAVAARWASMGWDDAAVWGRCLGSGSEPYETVVDHVAVASRCSCPSRQFPCKHALALLLLWSRGAVPRADAPAYASSWIAGRRAAAARAAATPAPASPLAPSSPPTAAPEPPTVPGGSDDRLARMMAGMSELDRWLADRMRTGLADPALARYATWDTLAARLIDAQAGSLANRVRRVAGLVGAHPDWHDRVLAELGVLHLLASAGRRLGALPAELGDGVAGAVGWQVRHADVMAGVPLSDHWEVLGRSDTREDRIEVRRTWLRGRSSGRVSMVLSFAAYGQSLDTSLAVGRLLHADVYTYPGSLGLRVLLGRHHGPAEAVGIPATVSLDVACASVGAAIAAEPWVWH